jgi:ATP-dependent protease ClpP protease subunit
MKKARLDIYKPIGSSWFEDGIDAESFIKDLAKLEADNDEIDIHINSPGGSVFDGLPIYNAIVGSKQTINVTVDGIAASMAAFIAYPMVVSVDCINHDWQAASTILSVAGIITP